MEIWKYPLSSDRDQVIVMPVGAQVLCLQTQYKDVPQIWALVDPQAKKAERRFVLVGTGWEIDPTGLSYIGTFQINQGALVFHLFER